MVKIRMKHIGGYIYLKSPNTGGSFMFKVESLLVINSSSVLRDSKMNQTQQFSLDKYRCYFARSCCLFMKCTACQHFETQ